MSVTTLPEFRSHGFDRKFKPLEERHLDPSPPARDFIRFLTAWSTRPLQELTVLDLGCGRGELVAALRSQGVRAFGIEIEPRFVESGRLLENRYPQDRPVLSTVDSRGRSIFPDGHFDLVVSDQVLEHVDDLSGVAAEVSRVLKRGGRTVHRFPGRFLAREPHYHLPFVHWLPKSAPRRAAIKALLAAGFSPQFFPDHDLDARTDIIHRYSVEETFYRPIREICLAFESEGIAPTFRQGMRAYVADRLGKRIPLAPLLAPLVATFRIAVLTGTKVR